MSALAADTFHLDSRLCERARLSRDARFDGLFFTAVSSTRIFCRPVCPAPPPKPENVAYYPSAAAAAAAGYRPCLRCRPELAPDSPAWHSGDAMVRAALHLIEEGMLDQGSVETLAARVGVGARHLRRLFEQHLGASPLQVAAMRRVLFAKKLLGETRLPVTDVALAAGFSSVRRFNAAFRDTYRMSPRELRRDGSLYGPRAGSGKIELRMGFRPPYDFHALLAFLSRRALTEFETVQAGRYRRLFQWHGIAGSFALSAIKNAFALRLEIEHPRADCLPEVVRRVRRMFDLDADATVIRAGLRQDPLLARLLRRDAGVRIPGAWDGFEIAVRAILGQQVSVAAARTVAARLVRRFGQRLESVAEASHAAAFPSAEVLAQADLSAVGLTRARASAIRAMARAVADGRVHFRREQGLDAFIAAWTELPGIGPWTAHYIAMRALGHPDAFPAADLVLRKAVGEGRAVSVRELQARAQGWRPWRAYATLLLWRSQA